MGEETLLEAMKDARARETARLEAIFHVNDVSALRLTALRDMILPEINGNSSAKALFDLNIAPGDVPRLWLNLHSSIVMEPNPKTYCLLRLADGQREVLFSTENVDEMKRCAIRHIAQSLAAETGAKRNRKSGPYAWLEMLAIWCIGLLCGLGLAVVVALCAGALRLS